jgi:hypothetical protein
MRVSPIPSTIFFFATLLVGSCQKQVGAVSQPISPLTANPSRMQFDTIQYGQKATGTWILKNTSGSDVVIRRIGPFSCQCVSANLRLPQRGDSLRPLRGDIINLTILPNETAEVIFTLDTARYRKPVSRKIGSIPIVFADHPGMVLEWAADVYTPFVVSPWSIALGNIGIRQQARGRAVVAAHDANEFILDIDGEYHGWYVKSNAVVIEDHQRSAYELIFTAPPEMSEGQFSQNFIFKTNLTDAPPVKINVQGVARPDIYVQPQRLLFDPSRDKLSQEFVIVQTAYGQIAPKLDSDAFAEQGFELEYSSNSDELVSIYKINYIGTPQAQGTNGTLQIITHYDAQPSIELSYTILPQR